MKTRPILTKTAQRPRPTQAAALLAGLILSVPFALAAMAELLF